MKATRPDFYLNNLSVLAEEETRDNSGEPTTEEKHLYALSQLEGWNIFKNNVERTLQEMDQLTSAAIASGASFESLGQNTVVIDLVKKIVRGELNRVEDAKQAVEDEQ